MGRTINIKSYAISVLRLPYVALICVSLMVGFVETGKMACSDDTVFLERNQLKSKMALFSSYMQQIEEILLDGSIVSSDQQKVVLRLLNNIESVTAGLGGSDTTNHRVIDEHIDQFKMDVSNAIRNAGASPPNYFALGRLAGSCAGCHKYRD